MAIWSYCDIIQDLIAGFDQEAAAVVMARLVSFKMETEVFLYFTWFCTLQISDPGTQLCGIHILFVMFCKFPNWNGDDTDFLTSQSPLSQKDTNKVKTVEAKINMPTTIRFSQTSNMRNKHVSNVRKTLLFEIVVLRTLIRQVDWQRKLEETGFSARKKEAYCYST